LLFPSHLTGVSTLPGETGNPEIVYFYLNAICCLVNRHTTHIKISPGHSWTILCCRNDRLSASDKTDRKENEKVRYVTHMLHYHVLSGVRHCVKIGSYSSPNLELKLIDSITGISYYLNRYQILWSVSLMATLSFSNTVHWCLLHSTQSNCCSAKHSSSFLSGQWPQNGPELNSNDDEI